MLFKQPPVFTSTVKTNPAASRTAKIEYVHVKSGLLERTAAAVLPGEHA